MPRERIPETGEPEQRVLFGPMDRHLRAVREKYGVKISVRGGVLLLEGEDPASVRDVSKRVKAVIERVRAGRAPNTDEVAEMLIDGVRDTALPKRGAESSAVLPLPESAEPRAPSGAIEPRSEGQRRYVEAIREYDVVIGVGPAGTGKTFLAVVEAVEALRSGAARKIILVRPAVEAGEKLGFLPGDFQAKINPYLRPLYDALAELITWNEVQRLMAGDVIEIVPLAYMRGRTLKDAFIILDEAQNTTRAQMKMFLTRMGEDSKIVITGDVTQIDLPEGTRSGLVESIQLLRKVDGIAVCPFDSSDIQRHALVQQIVDAYERHENWPREGRAPYGGDTGQDEGRRRRSDR